MTDQPSQRPVAATPTTVQPADGTVTDQAEEQVEPSGNDGEAYSTEQARAQVEGEIGRQDTWATSDPV